MALRLLPFSLSGMRRITTADKMSVGFQYLNSDNKEIGVIRYNLIDGYFVIFTWPEKFSALRKIQELMLLLSFARKIVKSENV